MVVVGDAADRPAASVKKDDRAARGFLRRVDANRNTADVTILDTDHLVPALVRQLPGQRPSRGDIAAPAARHRATHQQHRPRCHLRLEWSAHPWRTIQMLTTLVIHHTATSTS